MSIRGLKWKAVFEACPICDRKTSDHMVAKNYWGWICGSCRLQGKMIGEGVFFVINNLQPFTTSGEQWANEHKMNEEEFERFLKLRAFE